MSDQLALPEPLIPRAWAPITIAVDFDGTLVEKDVQPLQWRPYAKAFVVGAARAGVQMWLFSCRCGPIGSAADDSEVFWRTGAVEPSVLQSWRLFEEMRDFLVAEGVWDAFVPWTQPGKPNARTFYDDKAEAPNWLVAAAELGVTLAHADPGTTRPMGGPAVIGGAVVVPRPEPPGLVGTEPPAAPAGVRLRP